MDKVIKCEKQSDHILLTFEDGTTDKLSYKKLIEMVLIAKDPLNNVTINYKATIQEIIRLHEQVTGETLLPPQVAGKLWKAEKQVCFNISFKRVNEKLTRDKVEIDTS